MVIDPTTPLGKVRLRIGDWADIPMLPDAVITAALADNNASIPRTSQRCAQYILALLTTKTHTKLAQLEMWSGEQFKNYVDFLRMTILNPHMNDMAPIPYTGPQFETQHPLMTFVEKQEAQTAVYEQQQAEVFTVTSL